jgi:hypothetical protein
MVNSMKTVIEMARFVGARPQQNKNCDVEYLMDAEALERLVEFARADEREACMNALNALPYQRSTKYDCMDAIRARGNT